jgi:hypothetical protein
MSPLPTLRRAASPPLVGLLLAVAAATLLAAALPLSSAHGFLAEPKSRNYVPMWVLRMWVLRGARSTGHAPCAPPPADCDCHC